MAEGERHGMMDLEKELSCSICTDILYQPLTLLDCLHTFCGACLKEWFQFQASTATSIHPYTCPSCRASVRATTPNATVNTLLDMYMQANPGRGKTVQEKEDQNKKYKPGDNVLPKLRRKEDPGADEDRRLMEEVQELSLRELGISTGGLGAPRDRRRRDRSRERSREPRDRDRDGRRPRTRDSSRTPPEGSTSTRRDVPLRHVEHQSSLRSLLSVSEVDSQEMQEEIMRQIMEEGLLDGIDLNNIDVAQEDEISERIAQAYRRRQRERQRESQGRSAREGRTGTALPSPPIAREGRNETRNPPPEQPGPAHPPQSSLPVQSAPPAQSLREREQPRRRPHGRSESGSSAPQTQAGSHPCPPVSRPQLIDAANNNGTRHHRRSSSQGSTRSSTRAEPPAALSVTSSRQAARSASELNDRPSTSESGTRRRRMSQNDRTTTDPGKQQFRSSLNTHTTTSNPTTPRRSAFQVNSESPIPITSTTASAMSTALSMPGTTSRRTTDPTHARPGRPTNNSSPSLGVPRSSTEPSAADARPVTSSGAAASQTAAAPILFPEPDISCNRCGKQHIEYDLHYNCSQCDKGAYNLCLSCYRQSKGCKHWYGFGYGAWQRYERQAPVGGYPPNHEHPHILVGHRYEKPTHAPSEHPASPTHRMTDEDPAPRLLAGVFCDICLSFANSCYWKCDICNEGAWGFCNSCVNQGRHCTHPLLPLAHKPASTTTTPYQTLDHAAVPTSPKSTTHLEPSAHPTTPPQTPKSASISRGPTVLTLAHLPFTPLTFTTDCDTCHYPIQPSHTRFHCPRCNSGDYDICNSCYHSLVSAKKISPENGPLGWRRCRRGHRMVVIGFEDRGDGQRRVVTRDLVGGLALRDEDGGDSQARVTQGQNADVIGSPNWSWKDVDGTVRKSRAMDTTNTTSTSTSTSTLGLSAPARFPPDGGVGLRVWALWGYFPADGVKDELMFPKNAEVREAEDINGDWFWGCYAGAKGLFPGNYGRVL